MKTLLTTLAFLIFALQCDAFVPSVNRVSVSPVTTFASSPEFEDPPLVRIVESEKRGFIGSRIASKVAGLVSGLCGYVARGMAEDVEYAELPPPYVPAIFGVVLLAGVGILTASLGDVMTEEANLGLQSGARAKKEIERSRSSYFKRR
eukprot:CAMPEP_0176001702 /NCGR_PEP_ID=MMETSP0120_2-20121206/262_1 /TAXON_ID=160619 /ORGANISM="Kryptoperidinium foliaceum, Strain CCMP 1326" /LENGTH=147 /DNA_ID=CAMNT_0017334257 /DNA_START=68 /DNA_END=511 /DNA_ORIENTATION=-